MHEKIYDEFVAKMKQRVLNTKVGDPFIAENEYGAQQDKEQMDRILSYIDIGQNEGANLLIKGERLGNKGFFLKPSLFVDVKDDMRIA